MSISANAAESSSKLYCLAAALTTSGGPTCAASPARRRSISSPPVIASRLGRLVPVDEALALGLGQDVDRRRRAIAGADDRLAAPRARRAADDVHAGQGRLGVAIGGDAGRLVEVEAELL